jgi:hypothetical protein
VVTDVEMVAVAGEVLVVQEVQEESQVGAGQGVAHMILVQVEQVV